MKNVTLKDFEKKFSFKDRHVIYNCEESPESTDDRGLVRYHFCVSDDRFREEKIERIYANFQEKSIMNYSFREVRLPVEGKHVGTDYRYLFVSFDTQYSSKYLSFDGVSKNVKKDKNLRERKVGSIEDYVADLYAKK